MEKVNVNGIELAYTRRGNGTPLVLLHGFPLDHHIWDQVADHLEGIFDLILPDLRGFGGSTTVDKPYTMDDFASDIAGLLDQLGVEKAAIAGHSMGGYVALAFARLHPGRVSGLGLISSQVLADPPDRKEGRYKTAADVAENGIGGVVDAMTTKFTSEAGIAGVRPKEHGRTEPRGLHRGAESHGGTAGFHSPAGFDEVSCGGPAWGCRPVDPGRSCA
jgi:3-oxoadipate enol-lactonase